MPPHLTIQFIHELSPFDQQEDIAETVPLHLRVLAALSFYASGCYQRRVGMDAYCMMSQTTISKCIRNISRLISNNFSSIYIQFPQSQQEVDLIKERFVSDYNFEGVLGLVDATQIDLAAVSLDLRNLYINRKGVTSINTQGIVDSDLRFLSINTRYPGSTHDTFIWNNSNIFTLLEENFNLENQSENIYRDSFLIGDLGYPLQPWLIVPLRNVADDHEKLFNKLVRKVRSKNERGFAVLKSRFRCLLGERKSRYNHENMGFIICACVTLHNFLINNSFDVEHAIPTNLVAPDSEDDGDYDDEDLNIVGVRNNYLARGERVRNQLIADYF